MSITILMPMIHLPPVFHGPAYSSFEGGAQKGGDCIQNNCVRCVRCSEVGKLHRMTVEPSPRVPCSDRRKAYPGQPLVFRAQPGVRG